MVTERKVEIRARGG
jgi:hypothetical protein